MAPFSPQPVTPQKRHIEKSLEKANSILLSDGINNKSFYGSCKRTKLFSKTSSRFSPDYWSPRTPEKKKTDVYDFDENGETTRESPTSRIVKPYEIGFPNPPGANICWMNATLQIILGMRPLIDELEVQGGGSILSRNHYSSVFRAFLDVMRQRKRGRLFPVHKDLSNLKSALVALDSGFACEHQQDAPEFLIRLLDNFRDNFYENNYLDKKSLLDNSALKELNLDNKNTQTSITFLSENRQSSNPITDNLQFCLKEHYCCTSCEVQSERKQEHLTLYLDIPTENDDPASLQTALEQYMKTHIRELRCEKCSGEHCHVYTKFSQLPRILTILLKRYTCLDHLTQKITSSIEVPLELNLQNIVDENIVMPKTWSLSSEKENNFRENLDAESTQSNGNQKELDKVDTDKEDKDDTEFLYHLTGILSHHGDNPNTGHYVADVYHYVPDNWYHYDDEVVEKVKEEEVVNYSREQSGYMFIYTYRPIHDLLQSTLRSTRCYM